MPPLTYTHYTHLNGEVAHALGHAAEEAVPHLGGQGVDPLGPGRLQAHAEEEEGAEGHNFHISLVLRRCRVSDGTTNSDKGTLSPEMKKSKCTAETATNNHACIYITVHYVSFYFLQLISFIS